MSFFKTLLFLDSHQKSEEKTEIIESQSREISNSSQEIVRLKKELEVAKEELSRAKMNQVPQWKVTEMYKQQARNEELERDKEYYSSLLSKPMLEIAERSRDFKRTYEKQLALFAKLIIENHSLKELAQSYGVELGKGDEDFDQELDEAREVVESGNSQFDNNVEPERLKEVARLQEIEEEEKAREIYIKEQNEKAEQKARDWAEYCDRKYGGKSDEISQDNNVEIEMEMPLKPKS